MKKKTLSATMVACFLAMNMVAQNHACISIKVTNVPTPTGKVLLLTDKGQQAMVEAKGNEAIIQIYNAIKEIAEKEGYMRVDDRASSPSILYANPANDISDAVLSKMGYAK